MTRVLVAEDEYITAELFKTIIEELDHEIVGVAYSGEETIALAHNLQPDVIFLDINMEYRTAGIDACKEIKEECPDIKIYFLTAYVKEAFQEELARIQYDGYIDKGNFESVVAGLLKEG